MVCERGVFFGVFVFVVVVLLWCCCGVVVVEDDDHARNKHARTV